MSDSIPFALKKNIKDNEPNLKKNLDRLKAATGVDFTLEVNWAEIRNAVKKDEEDKNKLGNDMYERYMGALAVLFENKCKDAILKKALVDNISTKVIRFRFREGVRNYQTLKFENGALYFETEIDNFGYNMSNLESLRLEYLIPTTGSNLPVALQMNIAKNEPKLKERLAKIKKATGKDFTLDINFADIVSKSKSDDEDKSNFGNTAYERYMEYIANWLEAGCKDSMIKEAVVETTSKNKILIRLADEVPGFQKVKFENGVLVVECEPDNFGMNLGRIESCRIEDIL